MQRTKLEPLIQKYTKKWMERLKLAEYNYTIEFGNLKGDYAQVSTDEETRHITIQFDPRNIKTEEDVEKTVIHELLHVRINDYVELVEEIIRTHITNSKTRKLLTRRLWRLEHKILVPITDAFCEKEN